MSIYRWYNGNNRSYNGWRFITAAGVVRALVPGTNNVRIEIQRGQVATVLNAWAALWHRDIRRIDTFKPRDYWGWSATNDHPTSCHLSGTAIDLNATTLPFRERRMPADQRARVDAMVRQFKGVVAWGGHWSNPVDEMHAEIAVPEGDARLANLARELSDGYLGVYGPGSISNPAPAPAPAPAPTPEETDVMGLTKEQAKQLAEIHDVLTRDYTSRDGEYIGAAIEFLLNTDHRTHLDHVDALPAITDRLDALARDVAAVLAELKPK